MTITVDPGHWQLGNKFPPVPQCYEGTQMWKLSNHLTDELKKYGFSVINTRPAITDDPKINERGLMAAKSGSSMFISLHSNAVGGSAKNSPVRGTEVFYSIRGPQHKEFASDLAKAVARVMGHNSRGPKTLRSDVDPTSDYYGVLRSAANNGCTCAFLIEHGFHTNREDALFLADDESLKKIAIAEAFLIAKYLGQYKEDPVSETHISAPPTATVEQAKTWAEKIGATQQFINLANLYWSVTQSVSIDPVVAYCQSAKETRYGKFGGVIDATYCNPCGMKTKSGGADYDPQAHHRFQSWEDGVRAHVDHLALYAAVEGYPKNESKTPDPKHIASLKGRSKTVEGLGTIWAPSPTYGKEIVVMMRALQQTPGKQPSIDAIEQTVNHVFADGVISSKEYWIKILTGKERANPEYIKLMMDRYHEKLRNR